MLNSSFTIFYLQIKTSFLPVTPSHRKGLTHPESPNVAKLVIITLLQFSKESSTWEKIDFGREGCL